MGCNAQVAGDPEENALCNERTTISLLNIAIHVLVPRNITSQHVSIHILVLCCLYHVTLLSPRVKLHMSDRCPPRSGHCGRWHSLSGTGMGIDSRLIACDRCDQALQWFERMHRRCTTIRKLHQTIFITGASPERMVTYDERMPRGVRSPIAHQHCILSLPLSTER
ncbi:hypothetical protein JAAARDRAFT_432856 [Jaapia argillacea MUCL 33604]|uniref:Uncharacterized protein n=1 Tax=Jaapia argillacea MUCL 33604 TaxID=933084 RepID=A0A067PSM8_9AGAM|nr:hypothetical protein JAAARDRAFT_432856 [Jaapia argillacea MUCL 33604]